MRALPPPLNVTRPPPASTDSSVKTMVEVTVMVTGAAPQSKTMVPPAVAAARSAASVQLAAVPVPTTRSAFSVGASGRRSQTDGGEPPLPAFPAEPDTPPPDELPPVAAVPPPEVSPPVARPPPPEDFPPVAVPAAPPLAPLPPVPPGDVPSPSSVLDDSESEQPQASTTRAQAIRRIASDCLTAESTWADFVAQRSMIAVKRNVS